MIKNIFIYFIFIIYLNANDDLMAQKQNALYVQNLIEIEENIAKSFEKYMLTEFKLPTSIDVLITDEYLGSNFSKINRMGENIDFKDVLNLKIKYAITKDEYRKKRQETIVEENYMVQLYDRDLYRSYTIVSSATDITNSYVEIKLQSEEAKNIYSLIKAGDSIAKTCTPAPISQYCNLNKSTIRWYTSTSRWIEYSKKNLKGNVSTSIIAGTLAINLTNELKFVDLPVGTFVITNGTKYVKIYNPTNTFLKVD